VNGKNGDLREGRKQGYIDIVNNPPRAAFALHGDTRLGNHSGGALELGGGLIMRLAVK
jgi:hypothetical protein